MFHVLRRVTCALLFTFTLSALPATAQETVEKEQSYHRLQPCSGWSAITMPNGRFGYLCTYQGSSIRVPDYTWYQSDLRDLENQITDLTDLIYDLEARLAELESK